jgi:hypothetical protein
VEGEGRTCRPKSALLQRTWIQSLIPKLSSSPRTNKITRRPIGFAFSNPSSCGRRLVATNAEERNDAPKPPGTPSVPHFHSIGVSGCWLLRQNVIHHRRAFPDVSCAPAPQVMTTTPSEASARKAGASRNRHRYSLTNAASFTQIRITRFD